MGMDQCRKITLQYLACPSKDFPDPSEADRLPLEHLRWLEIQTHAIVGREVIGNHNSEA